MTVLDLLRLFLGAAILAFASWTDWKWRRAPNELWILLAGAGGLLLLVEAATDFESLRSRWPYLAAIPLIVAIVFGLWWFGLIAGGADAKALMALALLLPFPLAMPWLHFESPMPGSVSVLGNSLLAVLAVPLGLFLWNLATGNFSIPRMFLARRVGIDDARRLEAWPMERVENGEVRTSWFPSRHDIPIEEALAELREAGVARVWVTPKIPFMIPMLAGFILAFFVGDLLLGLVATALGPS